jgi:hypothetical protein
VPPGRPSRSWTTATNEAAVVQFFARILRRRYRIAARRFVLGTNKHGEEQPHRMRQRNTQRRHPRGQIARRHRHEGRDSGTQFCPSTLAYRYRHADITYDARGARAELQGTAVVKTPSVFILTVSAVALASSVFIQAASAQQLHRSPPGDQDRARIIEECMEMNRKYNTDPYGRTGGVEHMYHACMANHGLPG